MDGLTRVESKYSSRVFRIPRASLSHAFDHTGYPTSLWALSLRLSSPVAFEELLQDAAYIDEVPKHERFQPIPFVRSVDQLTRTKYYLQGEANGPVRKLPNLKDIPQCVVTAGSSFHTEYDYATVAFLRQAGVPVSHLKLPEDFGLYGNGHLLMLEHNSLGIANWLIKWIIQTLDPPTNES